MEGARPSSATAPSIWYAEVATPQAKSSGRAAKSIRSVTEFLSACVI